jgi:thiol-disulfide isomerase/thioredoxin
MVPFSRFAEALPYAAFLEQFGTPEDQARWDRVRNRVQLTEEQLRLLRAFTRQVNVLVLAGAWCGDCAAQCPILERMAEIAPVVQIRYLDRDAFPEVQKELAINGGQRVPVAVFFSEDGFEVARFGERTLTEYRRQVQSLTGKVWPEVQGASGGEHEVNVAADWLHELERVQWLLRLSPRLRRLHGD